MRRCPFARDALCNWPYPPPCRECKVRVKAQQAELNEIKFREVK